MARENIVAQKPDEQKPLQLGHLCPEKKLIEAVIIKAPVVAANYQAEITGFS